MHWLAKWFNAFENLLLFLYGLLGTLIKMLFSCLDQTFLANGRFQKTIKRFILIGLSLGILSMVIHIGDNSDLTFNNFYLIFKDGKAILSLLGLIIVSGILGIVMSLIIFYLLFTLIKISKENQADVFIITFGILMIYTIIVVMFEIELNTFFVISLSLSSYLVAIVDLVRDNYDKNSLIYKFRNLPLYIMVILSIYLFIKDPDQFSIGYIDLNIIDINAVALGSIALVFAGIGLRRMKP
jgi:hypothetical protein